MKRRDFINFMNATPFIGMALPSGVIAANDSRLNPWAAADKIVAIVKGKTSFKKKDFSIVNFGAQKCELDEVPGYLEFGKEVDLLSPRENSFDNYPVIAKAIEACNLNGGGRVVIPRGNWFCAGPVVLKSNVCLHLNSGAKLYFSPNPIDYAKYGSFDCGENGKLELTRWQGNDCLNYASMIYAIGQSNIGVTADDWTAVLDGQAGIPFDSKGKFECWWTWKGSKKSIRAGSKNNGNSPNLKNNSALYKLIEKMSDADQKAVLSDFPKVIADEHFLPILSEANVPINERIFGLGHYLRPSMIHFIGCNNVLLSGYQVANTPFWQHNLVNCNNIHALNIFANSLGPNSDGFNPESCDHVLIDSCTFDSGDDCIAIKAGKNNDISFGTSRNIVVQNCTMQSGHGAITIGSEMAGGVENIYVRNINIENKKWRSKPLNTALRFKTNMNRGGFIRNFFAKDINIPNGVKTTPSYYKPLPDSPCQLSSVSSTAGAVITIDCDYVPTADNLRYRFPDISNLHFSNIKVGKVYAEDGWVSAHQAFVILGPVKNSFNGDMNKFKPLPVRNITISNCDFGMPVNSKNPIFLYNVQNLNLNNVKIANRLFNKRMDDIPFEKPEIC